MESLIHTAESVRQSVFAAMQRAVSRVSALLDHDNPSVVLRAAHALARLASLRPSPPVTGSAPSASSAPEVSVPPRSPAPDRPAPRPLAPDPEPGCGQRERFGFGLPGLSETPPLRPPLRGPDRSAHSLLAASG